MRLLDLGMDPFNFADALIGVLSQRLARKLCVHCKQAHVASASEIADLAEEYCSETSLDAAEVVESWRAQFGSGSQLLLQEAAGCDVCRRGYASRVVVYELLSSTPAIKHLVRTQAALPDVLALAQREGMVTLRQNAIINVLGGVLDLASARAVSS